ncbi:MAG: peptidoglycan-binding domain-containing protein, partial [Candidatus Omnitrophota bacterium]
MVIFSFFPGCSKKQENITSESESSSIKLTLPQIPKFSGPYKPANKDIQIALKNAGLYNGRIDGDIGPKTKKAIQQFQAKNDLYIDGEVGPKTWALLKQYL